jgi:acyl carrier protein
MNDVPRRLAVCFSNVFPDVKADEIPRLSTASLAAWDSVAHITLLSAVSEEFGLELAPEDYEQLQSFSLIVDHINTQPSHG